MPTYQYECAACGTSLEIVQSFSENALTNCPACGKAELKKVYGAVGVVFKGSGFYKTDSRKSSSATTASAPKPSETNSSSSSSNPTSQTAATTSTTN